MGDWMELPDSAAAEEAGEKSLNGLRSGDPPGADELLADHLAVFADGAVWDLGPAQIDADSDGVADSLTRDVDGLLTVYTDTDSDGLVDRITELDASGLCAVHDLDADTGCWQPTVLGRLD